MPGRDSTHRSMEAVWHPAQLHHLNIVFRALEIKGSLHDARLSQFGKLVALSSIPIFL